MPQTPCPRLRRGGVAPWQLALHGGFGAHHVCRNTACELRTQRQPTMSSVRFCNNAATNILIGNGATAAVPSTRSLSQGCWTRNSLLGPTSNDHRFVVLTACTAEHTFCLMEAGSVYGRGSIGTRPRLGLRHTGTRNRGLMGEAVI